MTRNLPHHPSLPPAPQRHVLRQFETWICIVTIWGLVVNEWLGPAFLGLGLLLWTVYCLRRPGWLVGPLGGLGIIPWLVPLLGLLSVLWSQDPALSGRSAIQLGLTVALALMTASLVSPKRFIVSVWVVMGVVLACSLVQNNQHFDGITGRITMAGVFTNKNTLSLCSAIFALASLSICFTRDHPGWLRVAGFLGIGAGVVVCLLARSIGVTVAMFMAMALLTVVAAARLLPRRLRTDYAEMAFLGSLVGGALLLVGVLAFRDELLALVGKDSTLTGRTLLWFYADQWSQENPALGVGYNAFWLRDSAPAEYLWKKMRITARYGFHFHSLYYEVLIQLGYVGVAAGLLLVLRGVVAVVGWTRRSPDTYSGFFIACVLMVLAGQWQSNGLFSQFDPNCYLFLASAAYAANWCRQEAALRRMRAVHAHSAARRLIPGTA